MDVFLRVVTTYMGSSIDVGCDIGKDIGESSATIFCSLC